MPDCSAARLVDFPWLTAPWPSKGSAIPNPPHLGASTPSGLLATAARSEEHLPSISMGTPNEKYNTPTWFAAEHL